LKAWSEPGPIRGRLARKVGGLYCRRAVRDLARFAEEQAGMVRERSGR
jgi:hypothetical protein